MADQGNFAAAQVPLPPAPHNLDQVPAMAIPNEFMNSVHNTLSKLKNAMETQGAVSSITPFEGTPSKYNEWIKSIEKYAILASIDPENVKLIAYQTSKGAVSDYIKRRLTSQAHANETWERLKTNLATRFAEITDPQYAYTMLRNVRQKHGESVQMFAERLINLVSEAFVGQEINNDLVDSQCVGFFTDGLIKDNLKWRLFKANPVTLQDAIDVALSEENLRRRFDLRMGHTTHSHDDRPSYMSRGSSHREPRTYRRPGPMEVDDRSPPHRYEEPMDINHARPMRSCRQCGVAHNRTEACRPQTINAIGQRESRSAPRCFHCNSEHHFMNRCPRLNRADQTHQNRQIPGRQFPTNRRPLN